MAPLERRARADVADHRLEVGHGVLVGVGDAVGPHHRVVRDPDDAAGHARRPADQRLLLEHEHARRRRRRRPARRPCRRRPIRRSRSRPWRPTSSCVTSELHIASVDDYYESKVMSTCRLARGRRSMPSSSRTLTYPPRGVRARRRTGDRARHRTSGLPAGTEVFSADDHISLAEDIFYERFPESMKDQAPAGRVRRRRLGRSPSAARRSSPASSPRCSCSTTRSPGRTPATSTPGSRALESDGIHRELAFPNALLGPDGLARQGGPRALLPDLQRAHRRAAGALGRPLLRRRAHQLVGRRRAPAARSPR